MNLIINKYKEYIEGIIDVTRVNLTKRIMTFSAIEDTQKERRKLSFTNKFYDR
jgi:hypothetical protein